MEDLDYLLRILTYRRFCLELQFKKEPNNVYLEGQIKGLSFAITEIHKLIEEK
jgi:hypothetical protein